VTQARRFAARTLAFAVLCGFALGALLWMPAVWIAGLLPADVSCGRWAGRVWLGRCEGLSIRGSRSGDLTWALGRPGATDKISLTFPVQLAWSIGDSSARGVLVLAPQRSGLSLRAMHAVELDLSLQTLRNALPASVQLGPLAALEGRLRAAELQGSLDGVDRLQAMGEVRLEDVRLLRGDIPLGDFAAKFSAPTPSATPTTPTTSAMATRGSVRDLGGPLRAAGDIEFAPALAYSAVLRLEARSPSAAQALGIAGPFEAKLEGRF
jgi:hypothetical protein